jgi:hypothetical protein
MLEGTPAIGERPPPHVDRARRGPDPYGIATKVSNGELLMSPWRRWLRMLLPPIVLSVLRRFAGLRRKTDALFDGDEAMFKAVMATTDVYGEYGCGASTKWVAISTKAHIYSVDTSAGWIANVRSSIGARPDVVLQHINLGVLGDWGRPLSYGRRDSFPEYTDWLWEQPEKPQTVLIDGRFRVACFLTSVLRGDMGTTIIFDDYIDRPYYSVVEEVIRPQETCGRQARFTVPREGEIDRELAEDLLERFRYVMD